MHIVPKLTKTVVKVILNLQNMSTKIQVSCKVYSITFSVEGGGNSMKTN